MRRMAKRMRTGKSLGIGLGIALVVIVSAVWIGNGRLGGDPMGTPTGGSPVAQTIAPSATSNVQEDDDLSVPPPNTPRAIGRTSGGEWTIVPSGEEQVAKLGAPSCYGIETDYSFTGNYQVVYTPTGGQPQVVGKVTESPLVSQSLEPEMMSTIALPGAEGLLYYPQYTGCHGIPFYLFAEKDGHGMMLQFDQNRNEPGISDSFTTSLEANKRPKVVNGQLITETPQGAGQDFPIRYVFTPDYDRKMMVLIRTEQLDSKGGGAAAPLDFQKVALPPDRKVTVLKASDVAEVIEDNPIAGDRFVTYRKKGDTENLHAYFVHDGKSYDLGVFGAMAYAYRGAPEVSIDSLFGKKTLTATGTYGAAYAATYFFDLTDGIPKPFLAVESGYARYADFDGDGINEITAQYGTPTYLELYRWTGAGFESADVAQALGAKSVYVADSSTSAGKKVFIAGFDDGERQYEYKDGSLIPVITK